MRSPLRSSPQRSAGPPARIKEMKMPSPSSPPTMLKPRPVEPRWSTTRLGSLEKMENSNTALADFSSFKITSNHGFKGLTNTVQCIVLLFCSIVKDGRTNNQSYFYVQNSYLKILNYNYDSVYIILTIVLKREELFLKSVIL